MSKRLDEELRGFKVLQQIELTDAERARLDASPAAWMQIIMENRALRLIPWCSSVAAPDAERVTPPGILLTREQRDECAYYGVWFGSGGARTSSKFYFDNDLLCLCPFDLGEATATARDIATARGLPFHDRT